jgi:uncharacterized repeat protein (TIGR03803 family)
MRPFSAPAPNAGSLRSGVCMAAVLLSAIVILPAQPSPAQTYQVLYNFTGGTDGDDATSTLAIDGRGNLYGTTQFGGNASGNQGSGVAFVLKHTNSGWIETPLHTFSGGSTDGANPLNYGGLKFGPDGSLYGTASIGGAVSQQNPSGFGVVFRLRPPLSVCKTVLCPWNSTVLYKFTAGADGSFPNGGVTFDAAGNMYGTTLEGGTDFGVAYQIVSAGGNWTESVISGIGPLPFAGLAADRSGNLYGVNYEGGTGSGSIFQLVPSSSGWTKNVLYIFSSPANGLNPFGGLVLDSTGNVYGTTTFGGTSNGGTVFELSPAGDSWTLTTLHSFPGGGGASSSLTLDAAGNLYGTTESDGVFSLGSVFKLTPAGDSWTFTSLYDFQAGTGGYNPVSGVALDSSGNLYGTTTLGGTHGAGVVWEIVP